MHMHVPCTCATQLAYVHMNACTLAVYCVLLCVLIPEHACGEHKPG